MYSNPLPVLSGCHRARYLVLCYSFYINDLPSDVPDTSLYADDTALMKFEASLQQLHLSLQLDIEKVVSWMHRCHLSPNLNKTKAFIIGCAPADNIALCFPGSPQPIEMVSSHKHLAVVIDSALSWSEHMNYVRCRTSSALGALLSPFSHLPNSWKILFYRCYILPLFDYTDIAWCGLSAAAVSQLEIHHRKIYKRLFGKSLMHNSKHMYSLVASSPLAPLADRRHALVQKIYLKGEVKAKIKISPVVVFGVLSRMVLVRESWDAPFLLESQSNSCTSNKTGWLRPTRWGFVCKMSLKAPFRSYKSTDDRDWPICCTLLDAESTGFGPKRLRCSVLPLFPIEHGWTSGHVLLSAQITWSPRQQATTFTPRFNSSDRIAPKKVQTG